MRAIARIASTLSAALLLGLPTVALAHGGHGHGDHDHWRHERRVDHRDWDDLGRHHHRHHEFRHQYRHTEVIRERIYEAPVVYRPYRPAVVIHIPPVVIPF